MVDEAEISETSNEPRKKGKPTWQPGDILEVHNKSPNFSYRWVDAPKDDLSQVERRMHQGFHVVNKTTRIPGDYVDPNEIKGEHPVDSAMRCRGDLLLMALPDEMKQAHTEYIAERTTKQTTGLKDMLDTEAKKLHPDMKAEGRIVIE